LGAFSSPGPETEDDDCCAISAQGDSSKASRQRDSFRSIAGQLVESDVKWKDIRLRNSP